MDSKNLILESSDNQKIEIDIESAQKSHLLEIYIDISSNLQEPIKLPDIKFDILKKIVEYLTHYKDKTPKDIPRPMPFSDLSKVLDEWNVNFINSIELDNIFDLITAADYMDIPSLLDLSSAKMTSLNMNNTVQEIQAMFNIEPDLTEEELN